MKRSILATLLLFAFACFSSAQDDPQKRTLQVNPGVLKSIVQVDENQKKQYDFNPDYPDFYVADGGAQDAQLFLEGIWYSRNNSPKNGFRYHIQFSGMSRLGYFSSSLAFNSLEEFLYYQDIIENKKYDRIYLTSVNSQSGNDISVMYHSRKSIPNPK